MLCCRMHRRFFALAALSLALTISVHATTSGPELKAYDFARAYYIEDGGVVIVPQDGFYCPDAVSTPEGLRVMPGQTFTQFDPARLIMEVYQFTRLDARPAGGPSSMSAVTTTKSSAPIRINGASSGRITSTAMTFISAASACSSGSTSPFPTRKFIPASNSGGRDRNSDEAKPQRVLW